MVAPLVLLGLGVPALVGLGVNAVFPLATLGLLMTAHGGNEDETKQTRLARMYVLAECLAAVGMNAWAFSLDSQAHVVNILAAVMAVAFLAIAWGLGEQFHVPDARHWVLLSAALALDAICLAHRKALYSVLVLAFALAPRTDAELAWGPAPPKPEKPLPRSGAVLSGPAWLPRLWRAGAWLLRAGIASLFGVEAARKNEWAAFGTGVGLAALLLFSDARRTFR